MAPSPNVRALLDRPLCLNLDAAYVGAPRAAVASGVRRPTSQMNDQREDGTEAFRQRTAIECFDTAAVLRTYREPMNGETWMTPAKSERRLLAQVNAILALGRRAMELVASLAVDDDLPDPGRVYAALLVLGCAEGRVAIARLNEIFAAAATRNPDEAAAAIEAVSSSPNPEVVMSIHQWLEDERPRVRAAAVRVLSYRRALPESAWIVATRDTDPAVLAAAAAAPLGRYAPDRREVALQTLFSHNEELIVTAALRSGLACRMASARACAADIIRKEPTWAEATMCLSMFGSAADVPLIRSVIEGPHWRCGVQAAALIGYPSLVPDLLTLLEEGDGACAAVVSSALLAMTGMTFDPPTKAQRPSQVWARKEREFDARRRYRFGRLLDARLLLEALRAPGWSRQERQRSYLELLAVSEPQVPRFSAYDFVAEQVASLDEIERWLSEGSNASSVQVLH